MNCPICQKELKSFSIIHYEKTYDRFLCNCLNPELTSTFSCCLDKSENILEFFIDAEPFLLVANQKGYNINVITNNNWLIINKSSTILTPPQAWKILRSYQNLHAFL